MEKGEKATQIIGTIIGLIALPLLISWGMKASERRAEKYPWTGSFYTSEILRDSDEFKTLEECREWALKKGESWGLEDGQWDYDCGKGCTYSDQSIVGGKQVKTYKCTEIQK